MERKSGETPPKPTRTTSVESHFPPKHRYVRSNGAWPHVSGSSRATARRGAGGAERPIPAYPPPKARQLSMWHSSNPSPCTFAHKTQALHKTCTPCLDRELPPVVPVVHGASYHVAPLPVPSSSTSIRAIRVRYPTVQCKEPSQHVLTFTVPDCITLPSTALHCAVPRRTPTYQAVPCRTLPSRTILCLTFCM